MHIALMSKYELDCSVLHLKYKHLILLFLYGNETLSNTQELPWSWAGSKTIYNLLEIFRGSYEKKYDFKYVIKVK